MTARHRMARIELHVVPRPTSAVAQYISEYGASKNVDPLFELFTRYDLYRHVVELEAYGMTLVPPEKLHWSPGFAARLRDAVIRTCERRNGISMGDYRTARTTGLPANKPQNSWHLLEEDDAFVEAATNPVQLALVHWLCGRSAVFGGQSWIIKAPSEDGSGVLPLHSDSHGLPPGSGSIAHMCNASVLCTDYRSADDGPTVFVPGSHKFGRATLPHETADKGFKTFPLIGRAGSLALWNGATWHGSVPRTTPGLRITLVQNFFRTYMRPQIMYDKVTSPELLEKFPELKKIIGKKTALYPYEDPMNPNFSRVGPFMQSGTDPYA